MPDENKPPEEPHPDEPSDESVPTTGDGESATRGGGESAQPEEPRSVPSEDIEDPAPPETQAPSG